MDYILWEISFSNLIMLLAAIPRYDKDKDGESDSEEMNVEELANLF